MSTLQAKVEQYVGTVGDTAALTDQLTAGAKFISEILPKEKLEAYATDLTDAGSGIAITGVRPLAAQKAGYPADYIPKEMKSAALDSGSIHYANTRCPSWYIDASKGYVIPGGGTINAYTYPTATYSLSAIVGFPAEYEQGVILFTAVQQCIDKLNTVTDALNSLSYSVPTPPTPPGAFTLSASVPTAPTDASYSYSNASLGTYTSTTIGSLGTEPTYTKPTTTFSLTNALTYIETDEDMEKGLAELNTQSQLLEQYGKDLYNELNEFNKELEVYKSTSQKAIEQARLDQERLMLSAGKTTDLNLQNAAQTLNAAIELYRTKLEKYASQLNSYGLEVNAEVQTYAQNINKFTSSIQLYSNEIQNAVSKYQGDISKYTNEQGHYKLLLDSLQLQFENYIKVLG